MKKLGMGMEVSVWLISMLFNLVSECEDCVTKQQGCCEK